MVIEKDKSLLAGYHNSILPGKNSTPLNGSFIFQQAREGCALPALVLRLSARQGETRRGME